MPSLRLGLGLDIMGSNVNQTPAAPTLLAATVYDDVRIDLAWTVNATGQDGHRIYISTDNVTFTEKGTVSGTTATYSATSLTANTQYYFKVVAYKGAIESDASNTVSPKSYHSEIGLYITGLTTALSSTQKGKLNTLVNSLKTGLSITNLSDSFDVLRVLAGETSESSLKNIVKDAHHATAVNSPTFAAFEGFTGNGTSSYINEQYNPSTDKVRYALDSSSYGLYLRSVSSAPASTMYNGAINAASERLIIGVLTSGTMFTIALNSSTTTGSTVGDSFVSLSRNASANFDLYKNKTKSTLTVASSAIPNRTLYTLACNNSGTAALFINYQIAISYMGKGFTETQIGLIVDAIEVYMDSNGKGKI